MIFRSTDSSSDSSNKTEEFFKGCKDQKWARAYTLWIVARRIVFTIILVVLSNISTLAKLICMTVFQILYIANLLISRPYDLTKDFLVDVINEIYFSSYLSSLFIFIYVKSWGTTQIIALETWIIYFSIFLSIFLYGSSC